MRDQVEAMFNRNWAELADTGHVLALTVWPIGEGAGVAYSFTDHVDEAPVVMRRMAGHFEQAHGRSTAPEIYLAARYSRAEEMRQVRQDLAALGLFVTSRWIDGQHELTPEGSAEAHEADRTRFAQEDRRDLYAAHWVISFSEEPRMTKTRGGRHVELGLALALGKRAIVVGHRENVFHHLPEVEFYPTWIEALAALTAEKTA